MSYNGQNNVQKSGTWLYSSLFFGEPCWCKSSPGQLYVNVKYIFTEENNYYNTWKLQCKFTNLYSCVWGMIRKKKNNWVQCNKGCHIWLGEAARDVHMQQTWWNVIWLVAQPTPWKQRVKVPHNSVEWKHWT